MKAALIVGGAALALLVVWKLASATASPLVSTGTGTGTSLVPGSSGGGTGSSTAPVPRSPSARLVGRTLPGGNTSASAVAGGIAEDVLVGPSAFIYNSIGSLL